MAAKYMGAKMLKKQLEKEKAKAQAKEDERANKKNIQGNQGEILDRKKQKFDITQSTMAADGDFIEIREADILNPKFEQVYNMLSKRGEYFLLTMNESMLETANAESESEEESQQVLHEMVHKANT